MIGGRSIGSTSTSVNGRALRPRRNLPPPAARRFRAHWVSPQDATRKETPSSSRTLTGVVLQAPLLRPRTARIVAMPNLPAIGLMTRRSKKGGLRYAMHRSYLRPGRSPVGVQDAAVKLPSTRPVSQRSDALGRAVVRNVTETQASHTGT